MLTLATAYERDIDIGTPLPEAWPALTKAGIRFRRSQVIMVAGQPNACKSIFGLNLAIKMGVPTLYYSADTDDYTTTLRAAAALSGATVNQIEEETKDPTVKDYYMDLLGELSDVWWSFVPEPTPEAMDLQLGAFLEMQGAPPELVIVDNLVNCTIDSDNEWSGMRKMMKLLSYWARTTRACVVVLHHCREESDYDARFCPPRSSIQGKLSQYPSLILTLDVIPKTLKVACVKNRHGPHDRTGETFVMLDLDQARMSISEPEWTPWLKLKGAAA